MKYTLAALALLVAGRSSYAPDAGHEIVLVRKPWFFGHGGIDQNPVTTGRIWAAVTTQGIDVSAPCPFMT